MTRFRNRYGDVYTFTKQKDGNVLMEGDFNYCRTGDDFIDPSGGPFLKIGQMLSHVVYDDEFNVIIEGFSPINGGVIIKTKSHEYDPNDTSHLADTKIIGGIINTSYDE